MPSSVGIVFSDHPFNETKSRQPIQSAGGIQPDIVPTFLHAGIPVGWIMEYFQSPSLVDGVFQHVLAYASPPGDAGPLPRLSYFPSTDSMKSASKEAESLSQYSSADIPCSSCCESCRFSSMAILPSGQRMRRCHVRGPLYPDTPYISHSSFFHRIHLRLAGHLQKPR